MIHQMLPKLGRVLRKSHKKIKLELAISIIIDQLLVLRIQRLLQQIDFKRFIFGIAYFLFFIRILGGLTMANNKGALL
jgi:hypothetical protein